MLTEQQLIAECLSGNRIAQRELYDRYKKAMYTLAYRITGNFEDAGDALQEGFVEVFRHLGQFRKESTLGAWIKVIIVRKSLQQKRMEVFEPLTGQTNEPFVDWIADSVNAAHLEEAILSLPVGYRTVFVLTEVEGYTHHEVAQICGISEGTSKSQLFYAKKRLKTILTSKVCDGNK
ncbi:MAG: RNA polymerase subunit sigma-24 [Cytophagaceae bacterium SCN 52-12]|nr:MAG: RNA polymerase subunit sigma-24 [Cytophagaceae bacterium SCN 52-12]